MPPTPTLFSKSQLDQVKIKKEKPKPTPITLNSYILFGKYQGRIVADVIADIAWISWYCQKTKQPLSREVTHYINLHQNLSR